MAKKKSSRKAKKQDVKSGPAAVLREVVRRRLIAIRAEMGLSQLVVAERAGMHGSSYNDIECGRVDVRLSGLARIAAALGVSVADVVSDA